MPIVNSDWWETIEDTDKNKSVGQVQVLQALGSEEQINNLKTERGFGKDFVTSKFEHSPLQTNRTLFHNKSSARQNGVFYKSTSEQCKNDTKKLPNEKLINKVNTADIGVQSEMASPKLQNEAVKEDKRDILLQTISPKSTNAPEVAIKTNYNAENRNVVDLTKESREATNFQLRETSDLLNSLQKALAVEISPKRSLNIQDNTESFRAHIIVENALHLPSRKKCKSKKSKAKNSKKHEDVLPSVYVTFETLVGRELNVTPVVQKSVNPRWDYRCDVDLPVELLTNVSIRK